MMEQSRQSTKEMIDDDDELPSLVPYSTSSQPEASTTTTVTTTSSSSPALSSSCSFEKSVLDDTVGILEHILSFVEPADLLNAGAVSRRWKLGGRGDPLWQAAIRRLWAKKKGVHCSRGDDRGDEDGGSRNITLNQDNISMENRLIFWRGQFKKERVQNMTVDEIQILFQHPLLTRKRSKLEESLARIKGRTNNNNKNNSLGNSNIDNTFDANTIRALLEHTVLLHMFDVMFPPNSDGELPPCGSNGTDDGYGRLLWYHFADLSFGSYACSVRDGRRRSITKLELCTPFGFETFHKVTSGAPPVGQLYEEDDRADGDDGGVDNTASILMYPDPARGTWFFSEEIVAIDQGNSAWKFTSGGKVIEVQEAGMLYLFSVSRRKDWGWKLESEEYVLFSLDTAQNENGSVNDSGNVRPASRPRSDLT